FIVVNVSVIKLRREYPNMNRPYEIPYYPAPPVLGILLNLLLTAVLAVYLVRTDPLALVLSIAWILVGVVAYYGIKQFMSGRETGRRPQTEVEPVPTEDD
ncbi:MAG: amino acid transporter, partial [Halobacteria archaeon]|nr:amino acid transporter [Halobacteria archaeon]